MPQPDDVLVLKKGIDDSHLLRRFTGEGNAHEVGHSGDATNRVGKDAATNLGREYARRDGVDLWYSADDIHSERIAVFRQPTSN